MNAYIYAAALHCEDCALGIKRDLRDAGKEPADVDDEGTYESDDYPKGPFGDGGGEADTPAHCDSCGVFLENPLTTEGYTYVRDAIADAVAEGRLDSIVCTEWREFYGHDGVTMPMIPSTHERISVKDAARRLHAAYQILLRDEDEWDSSTLDDVAAALMYEDGGKVVTILGG